MQFVRIGQLSRNGLSFVEFVGCLAALCGGVVLGSMYLGVDIKSMAVSVLQRSQIVDPEVFGSATDSPEQATADGEETTEELSTSDEAAETPGESTTDLPVDSEQTVSDAVAEPTDSELEPTGETSAPPVELSDEQREAATIAYWKALAACVQEEAVGRQASMKNTENWQLFDYLTHREQGHQRAVDAIEQLDETGVDEKLLSHSRQVLSWQLAGSKLFGRAVDLLTDGPSSDLSGPFAQSWQSSATQHRMEEKLIREKHRGVAGYLEHTYKSLATP